MANRDHTAPTRLFVLSGNVSGFPHRLNMRVSPLLLSTRWRERGNGSRKGRSG